MTSVIWNRLNTVLLLVILLAIVLLFGARAYGGPLNPSGTPGPTMKTLQEVEPRIPISTLPATISSPGSYYLTGELSQSFGGNGITIAASNVTLDLSGFSIDGSGFGSAGISVAGGSQNVTIRNGTVFHWTSHGIDAQSAATVTVDGIRAIFNGLDGISIASNSVARNCIAMTNGGDGITANASLVENCVATNNSDNGIRLVTAGRARNCRATSNAGAGIFSDGGYVHIEGCTANSNVKDGIVVSSYSTVLSNQSDFNGAGASDGAGIQVTSIGNRIEANTVAQNDRGYDVDTGGNVIVRNQAKGNTNNYGQVVAGNVFGPVVDPTNVGTSTNPHANYAP